MEYPILIIQGGKDFRVPIGQGQEAFKLHNCVV
jgi:dipeptidyl aminopeptidase/acylaminoacyl peptidase